MNDSSAATSTSSRALLVLALLLAGVAAYLMWMYGRHLEQTYQPGTPEEVVTARVQLTAGTKLRMVDLQRRSMPANYIRSGVVRARDVGEVEGRTLVNGLEAGDPLQWSDMAGSNEKSATLGEFLSKAERAMTIRVDKVSSAGGNLKPGDRVDVMATLVNPQKGRDVTITLLKNVAVLATGTKVGRSALRVNPNLYRGFDTVTILLHDAEEAEMLTFAQNQGKLDLVVRSPESMNEPDESNGDLSSGSDFTTIFGVQRKKIQVRRDKKIEILRSKGR